MITEEQYNKARVDLKTAQEVINQYYKEKREAFDERLKTNPIFTDNELVYSAFTLCKCGYGIAYPKECGPGHYWDCSAILKGIADTTVEHIGRLPFNFYDVKSESKERGTTRGVFKPRPKE